jgi:hypothetical protein
MPLLPFLAASQVAGEVSEWLKELAWKASGRVNRLVGSNPTLSALSSRGERP